MSKVVPALIPLALLAAVVLADPQQAPAPAVETAKESPGPNPVAEQDGLSVYFSPSGNCTEAVVHEIDGTKESIQVLAYAFTSAPIAKALTEAHKRGVKVAVILDEKENKGHQYTEATFLDNQGIPVYMDGKHAIAHNKVMILDGDTIITGSFNFTKAAEESNAENLLIIRGKSRITEAYAKNFREHLKHSTPYVREEGEQKAAVPGTPPTSAESSRVDPPKVAPDPAPAEDPIVHVTRTGKRYHCAGCRSLSKSDIPMHLSEAKEKGYTPCGVCHPPE